MKQKILYLIGLLLCSNFIFSAIEKPLLVVVLMVKNEEAVMVKTLKPFIEGGVKQFLIFDTGSTDKTVEVTDKYLKSSKVSYFIEQEPFIDFAASRTRALRLAEQKFPNAEFMLMPDAEWYLVHTENLLKICEQLKKESETSYYVRIMNKDTDFYVPRLIRCHKNVKFWGRVHEVLDQPTMIRLPLDIYFFLDPSHFGIEKSQKRWQRDKELLLADHLKEPQNTRTCFYLAQTFMCLGDFANARKYYKKRIDLGGWDEEVYIATYRLALCTEMQYPNHPKNWQKAERYYLRAYSQRPSRAEPLIRVAHYHLNQKNMPLAYLYANQASKIQYPMNDILFIEKEAYENTRFEILGQASWNTGKYKTGEWATKKLLTRKPEDKSLLQNLSAFRKAKIDAKSRAIA